MPAAFWERFYVTKNRHPKHGTFGCPGRFVCVCFFSVFVFGVGGVLVLFFGTIWCVLVLFRVF